MKPSINMSLVILAQELNERVSLLVKDEYEVSRLGAWAGMLFIASMKVDDLADSLYNENIMMLKLFDSYKENLSDELQKEIQTLDDLKPDNIKVSSLDQFNQKLRSIIIKAHKEFEENELTSAIVETWEVLRFLHQNRKTNHLLEAIG
ncbi:MAG: hypothetical protein ACJ0F4_00900 [Gammaproteobacteria bacterium]